MPGTERCGTGSHSDDDNLLGHGPPIVAAIMGFRSRTFGSLPAFGRCGQSALGGAVSVFTWRPSGASFSNILFRVINSERDIAVVTPFLSVSQVADFAWFLA
jgi:hypothetical protein